MLAIKLMLNSHNIWKKQIIYNEPCTDISRLRLLQQQQKTNSQKDKNTMSDICKFIVTAIWNWCKSEFYNGETPPNIFFYEGGINSINPFSALVIKDENIVYGGVYKNFITTSVNSELLKTETRNLDNLLEILDKYASIYIDMNGSMAWYDEKMQEKFNIPEIQKKIKGVFVMGGVLNYSKVNTIGANPFLNRFSCATMNQLYHGENTKSFFNGIQKDKLFFVTNNEINANFNYSKPQIITYNDFENQMVLI